MKELLYLIGQPGSGKTTLLKTVLEGLPCETVVKPFAMRYYPKAIRAEAVQFGADREKFGGTDTLGLAVQPLAERFLAETLCPFILAEGDRLGNHKFFKAAAGLGWKVTVALLSTPDDICAERRKQRGSTQNERWIEGRKTKINKLIGWCHPQWVLDGCQCPLELAPL